MKNLKPTILLILILFLTATAGYSQHRISLNAGASLPSGVFGIDDFNTDGAGGAATGVAIGFNYSYSFKTNPFGVFVGADMLVNGLTTDVKRAYIKEFEGMGINNADFRYSNYFNIPLTAGFNLNIKMAEKSFFFVSIGPAFDILKLSDMVVTVSSESLKISTDSDMATGYKIGGGFHFNKLSLVFNYLDLGKHDLNGTMSSGPYSETVTGSQKVQAMTVTLGIKL